MDGFEATRIIKDEIIKENLEYIPIVGVTAYASKKVEDECLEAGMDAICKYSIINIIYRL